MAGKPLIGVAAKAGNAITRIGRAGRDRNDECEHVFSSVSLEEQMQPNEGTGT